jgi:hypothetical protein
MTHYFDDLLRDANGKSFFTNSLGHTGTDDLWNPPSTAFDLWKFTLKAAPKKNLVSQTYLSLPTR